MTLSDIEGPVQLQENNWLSKVINYLLGNLDFRLVTLSVYQVNSEGE